MNKRGQKSSFGLVFVVVAFLLIISSFALIDPLIESLNTARDNTELNCPGTLTFNQSDYADDSDFERLVRRPTCFATGFLLVYFIGAFVIGVFVWTMKNWRRITR